MHVSRMTGRSPATSWARAGGLGEFVVFAPGEGRLDSGETFTMDAQAARNVIASFSRDELDRVVDYDHQTIDPRARGRDGLAPAAGWISRLRWDPARGLVAAVTWTERGEQLVASGRYRFCSPVFNRDRNGRVSELCSVGLTNSPAILDSRPIAASRSIGVAWCAIGQPQQLICSNRGEPNMPVSSVFQSNPQLVNDASESVAGDELLDAIAAIGQAFNERDFAELVRERAVEFVQVVRASFNDEDLTLLGVLSNLAYGIKQGESDESLAGGLMKGEMEQTLTQGHGRAALIAAAKKTYAEERANPEVVTICSEKAWVDTALRDAHQQPVTEREVAGYGVSESDAPNSTQRGRRALSVARSAGGAGTKDRAFVIAAAKREFARWANDPAKRVICDELGHVNTCLRDAGQVRLTRDEMNRHNVVRRG